MGQQTAGTPVAPTAHPQVESIKSMRSQTVATDTKRKSKYTIKVDGKSWVDTGVSVNAGDQMTFSADGNMQSVDGRKFAPDGVDRGWKDMLRQFPLDSAKAGSLLGRISDNPGAVPFLIGASSKLVAPQSGHLFVRANLPDDLGHRDRLKPDQDQIRCLRSGHIVRRYIDPPLRRELPGALLVFHRGHDLFRLKYL